MIIENVGLWDYSYTLYKASYKNLKPVYGTSYIQAISNMLGQINGLEWNTYFNEKGN